MSLESSLIGKKELIEGTCVVSAIGLHPFVGTDDAVISIEDSEGGIDS